MHDHQHSKELRSDVLAFGVDVHAFTTAVLSKQTAAQDDNTRIFLFAQAIRMHRTAEAVRTLVAAELNDAAGAVLRCLLEQMYVFVAVHNDSSNLQRLAAEGAAEGHKALSGLLQMSATDRGAELTDQALTAALETVTAGARFNVFLWAQRAGFLDQYRTLWRTLCTYSHGSITAVSDYLDMDQDGVILGIRSKVAQRAAIEFVLVASGIALDAVCKLNIQANPSELELPAESLASRHGALYARYWALPP